MTKEFYRIFSLIFHRPEKEFARYLRNGFIEDISFLDGHAIEGFSKFLKENRERNDEDFYNVLAVEYTRLFINAVPKVPCSPYESIYRENMIMGNTTLDVVECYAKAGLKAMENFHDLPDHVAVELEFFYYLMNNENVEMHNAFVRKHVSRWVPEFCEQVEKYDRIGFYGHAARILREFIKDNVEVNK